MAGTVSTNPVLLMLAALLMMAWKTAGYIGVDRYLLPRLGVPWRIPKR
jgi:thiosulfate dehydrogenase [quinone] large subunit